MEPFEPPEYVPSLAAAITDCVGPIAGTMLRVTLIWIVPA
jgi:hypothetical protein